MADGFYVAYTDGSCKDNPGPGGCAFRLYAPDGQIIEKSRQSLETTNNKAEMWAVIDALTAIPEDAPVLVCLDSGYIKDGIEQHLEGWLSRDWRKTNGQEVRNRELWEKIIALMATREVTFHKIKAHSGDPDNEHVDAMAGKAADKAARKVFRA
ncbi:ribonuclease H family protein [Roseovarius sp. 217]|uniref:ribonuclease H family protein n=1 Tax=Roseovarius sp. (strain 217) TaxID=314264 RepID=UPI0018DE5B24|nr:ribonuclease H [Roseovarius sp. 217]